MRRRPSVAGRPGHSRTLELRLEETECVVREGAVRAALDRHDLTADADVDARAADDRDVLSSRLASDRGHPLELTALEPERAEARQSADPAARGDVADGAQHPGV